MNANYVVAATETFIKVWDVEFGCLKYKTQLNCKFICLRIILLFLFKRINTIFLMGNSLSSSFVLIQNNEGKLNFFSLKEGKTVLCNWEVSVTNLYIFLTIF